LYYHSTELKYVEYGKILPSPCPNSDWFPAYKWLGHYCGYCPQIWLSQCDVGMTGFRNEYARRNDGILFGFDVVKGFGVDYELWHFFLNYALGSRNDTRHKTAPEVSEHVFQEICSLERECITDAVREGYEYTPLFSPDTETVDGFLKRVFAGRDQYVVPSLNLKAAKKIICRNEKQKKILRRMGFIEDRIKIMNVSTWKF